MTTLDTDKFFAALDAIRCNRRLSWRGLAAAADVPVATVCRIGKGTRPSVDTFVALLAWSGLDARRFFSGRE